MNQNTKIYLAIFAAGTGSRFQESGQNISSTPKQFLPIMEKPLLYYTIKCFMPFYDQFEAIFITYPKEYKTDMENLLSTYFPDKKIQLILGGEERYLSCANVLNFIEENYPLGENDFIITHDGVRPNTDATIIQKHIEAIHEQKYLAMNTVAPAVETIVYSSNREWIEHIPNRKFMYLGQSPQTFHINTYLRLYRALSEEDKLVLTESIKVFTDAKIPAKIILGRQDNLKLTHTIDYILLQEILDKE